MAAPNDLFDPRRDRRDGHRQPTHILAELAAGDWQCHTVDLIEFSAGGFRARHSEWFAPGEAIRIAIPGLGPVDARVKWSDGRTFGAEFLDPGDLRLLFLGGPVPPRSTWLERLAA